MACARASGKMLMFCSSYCEVCSVHCCLQAVRYNAYASVRSQR
uniref:Uncharacterized protein n=1 Tax=Arundo donax TaxID=35708 RepID=A0A0A9CDL9_ARUDO